MAAAIPNGVIALQAIGLRPAEILAPPDKLYLQSPERYEFVDITDLSKRYVISLQTGLYIPFSGSGGGAGISTIADADDYDTATLPAQAAQIATVAAKINSAIQSAIPFSATTGVATPPVGTAPFTPTTGVAPPNNYNTVTCSSNAGSLPVAVDGITSMAFNDSMTWSPSFGSWTLSKAKLATTDLSDATVLNTQTDNAQTGTTYTLVLADAGQNVDMNNAAANTLTIPLNAAVAFPIGTLITVTRAGAGATTIAFAGTIQKPVGRSLIISSQYETASLYKVATDTWRVLCG